MNQRKIGIVLVLLGTLFAIVLLYSLNLYTSQASSLGCTPSQECKKIESSLSLSYFFTGIVSAILSFGVYLMIFNKGEEAILKRLEEEKNSKISDQKFSILLKALDEYENKVMSAVREQQGITQATLRLRTGMSKAKLSRVLQDLEDKNLLKKEKSKKTNKIYLSEDW